MIISRGHLAPHNSQLKEARAKADESFCTISSDQFQAHFPQLLPAMTPAQRPILLKLKNVTPHDDPWVGFGEEPVARRAVFWLMEGGGSPSCSTKIIFGCGAQHIEMEPGDFVVFDDSLTHWVMSEKQWRGAAAQLIPS